MTLEARLSALATTIGGDVKTLLANQGSLAALSTTAKNNLIAAINEVYTIANNSTNLINDAATSGASKTYSIDKILAVLGTFKSDLLGGVPATAFDTLKEIADYIGTDQTATSGLVTAMALRVSVEAQTFTTPQKAQARANIGALSAVEVGNTDADFVAVYTAAKA